MDMNSQSTQSAVPVFAGLKAVEIASFIAARGTHGVGGGAHRRRRDVQRGDGSQGGRTRGAPHPARARLWRAHAGRGADAESAWRVNASASLRGLRPITFVLNNS